MDQISIDDFAKLDIRIGTVVKAEVPDWSHWVLKMKVDLGEEIGIRTIFSGIMKFYKPEDLEGKQFPFVINLKPTRIGPADENGEYEFSQGMMIMADTSRTPDDEDSKPVLFQLLESVPNGTKVR